MLHFVEKGHLNFVILVYDKIVYWFPMDLHRLGFFPNHLSCFISGLQICHLKDDLCRLKNQQQNVVKLFVLTKVSNWKLVDQKKEEKKDCGLKFFGLHLNLLACEKKPRRQRIKRTENEPSLIITFEETFGTRRFGGGGSW